MINKNSDSDYQHRDGGLLCPAQEEEVEVMGESEERGAGQEGEEAREVRAPSIPMTPSRAEVMQLRLKHHPI